MARRRLGCVAMSRQRDVSATARVMLVLLVPVLATLFVVGATPHATSRTLHEVTQNPTQLRPRGTTELQAPRTTSTRTATVSGVWAALARVQVHALEKCCPHRTHFAVQRYPSALEDTGWVPALTLHAFKYDRQLNNCWRIVNSIDHADSHVWQRMESHDAHVSTRRAFCLPTENTLPDARFAVYYGESDDAQLSIIIQPISDVSRAFLKSFSPSDWPSHGRFTRIFPLAYYYWRQLAPQRLIRDISIGIAPVGSVRQCLDGYDVVPGNLNFNFVLLPYVYFCVKNSDGAAVSPLINRDITLHDEFVTSVKVAKKHEFRPTDRDLQELCDVGEERVPITVDSVGLPRNYRLVTASGEPLEFCMQKKKLVLPGGRLREAGEFVAGLFLNYSQVARRSRLGLVYNYESDELGKHSPYGRLVRE